MQRFIQSRPLLTLTVVPLAALVAVAASRCLTPAGRPVEMVLGVDASGSARDNLLGPSVAVAVRLVSWLDPDRDRAYLYRVDHDSQRFCGPDVPPSTEVLQQTLIEQMQNAARVPGTYPANFWEQAASRADDATGPVAVTFFTDGDNDDASAPARLRMRVAAHRLAANPHVVAVYLYGVNKENSKTLDAEFVELRDRFHLYPATDLDIEPLCALLDKARAPA